MLSIPQQSKGTKKKRKATDVVIYSPVCEAAERANTPAARFPKNWEHKRAKKDVGTHDSTATRAPAEHNVMDIGDDAAQMLLDLSSGNHPKREAVTAAAETTPPLPTLKENWEEQRRVGTQRLCVCACVCMLTLRMCLLDVVTGHKLAFSFFFVYFCF